jgi:hypothetical protein
LDRRIAEAANVKGRGEKGRYRMKIGWTYGDERLNAVGTTSGKESGY